jgi:hypothetical protein
MNKYTNVILQAVRLARYDGRGSYDLGSKEQFMFRKIGYDNRHRLARISLNQLQ